MTEFNEDEYTSKSALKRESAELQTLGEKLITLSPEQLTRLPINDSLHHALNEAKRIRSHEARRRHAAYVGKLIRDTNYDVMRDAVAAMFDPVRQQRLVNWIDRLEHNPAELATLFDEITAFYTHADRQHLRQLLRQFSSAVKKETNTSKQRSKLHAYLRDLEAQTPLY